MYIQDRLTGLSFLDCEGKGKAMIGTKDREDWEQISGDPVQTVRALADWTADILTVMRLVSDAAGLAGLADSKAGTAYYHAEQVRHWLVGRATGGMTHTDITPELVARWVGYSAHRTQALMLLADEIADLLIILNQVSGGGAGLWTLAVSAEGGPYWHAGRAHQYVLALLTGTLEDGYLLHELWSDNQEPTAHNVELLQQHKQGNAVVVRVSADGNTATITIPGSDEHSNAGRVAESGLYWVTALGSDDVIGNDSSWPGVGHLVASYYNFPPDVRVIVDYTAPTATDNPADSAAGSALVTLGGTVEVTTIPAAGHHAPHTYPVAAIGPAATTTDTATTGTTGRMCTGPDAGADRR